MPLPTPNAGEKQEEFVARCMANPTMIDDFPDEKQRSAVCYSQWEKKSLDGEKCLACVTGATSFEELETLAIQEEMAEGMNELSMYANVMTGNIFSSPDIPLEQKPNALKNLMDGFIMRVKRLMAGKSKKDIETNHYCQVEGEGNHDLKSVTTTNANDGDAIYTEAEKQATKTEEGVLFRASDYAVVPDVNKPSGWKLRLAENSSGNFTVQQIAMAITAMQPGGLRGNKVDLEPGDKKQAIQRINAAISKSDGDDTQKENLRKRLNRVKAYKEGAFIITKKDGVMRWLGIPSNKWRDRDNPPQIIEEAAHKEFVEHLQKTGEYPVLLGWHTPGTRLGVADFADYVDGFLIMGGTIDKDKYEAAENLADLCTKEKIGMSHGFVYKYSDEENEVIGWIRTWEVSHLPLSKAANLWTSIEVLTKEVKEMPLTDERRSYLNNIYGKDTIDKMLEDIETNGKTLASMGVEFKEVLPADALVLEVDQDEVVSKAVKAIVENESFKGLIASVGAMDAALKELTETVLPNLRLEIADAKGTAAKADEKAQKTVDDIVADAFSPRSKGFIPSVHGQEPSEADREKEQVTAINSPLDSRFRDGFLGPVGT